MDMKESLGPAAVFPLGEENEAYAQYFVGKSYLAPLTGADAGVGVSNVTFEPGCRNHWHVHHAGRPARELEPGDVVSIPPETKHWHGAAPDSWFSHVAIAVPAEGASNEWLEPVSDEDYAALA